jgi:hypothetical protein
VDLPALRSLGQQVVVVGEDLGRNVSAVHGRLGPSNPSGLPAIAAADAAAQGWAAALVGLAGRVRQTGEAVGAAANSYQGADERAARRQAGSVSYR